MGGCARVLLGAGREGRLKGCGRARRFFLEPLRRTTHLSTIVVPVVNNLPSGPLAPVSLTTASLGLPNAAEVHLERRVLSLSRRLLPSQSAPRK